nr:GNAT family N-acetyltransferase [Hymenobacter lucidus]
MYGPGPLSSPGPLPAGYAVAHTTEHGAQVLHLLDVATGQPAATGRVVLHQGCAVFDRIETMQAYRRRGLGTIVMGRLDALAEAAGASERLLVATEAGRALYQRLGWQVVAPYATAVLPTAPARVGAEPGRG